MTQATLKWRYEGLDTDITWRDAGCWKQWQF
jgi:hypothetical protein